MDLYYGLLIERSSKKLKHEFQKELYKLGYDITVDQWVIIYELFTRGTLSQIELATSTYKDAPTVTRIIDLLINKNYLEKMACPNDRRKFLISLSEKGREMVEDILPHLMAFRKKGWSNLSKEDFSALQRILNQVFNNFD